MKGCGDEDREKKRPPSEAPLAFSKAGVNVFIAVCVLVAAPLFGPQFLRASYIPEKKKVLQARYEK